nr:helix-turn-helix domain-containing protein [Acidisoma sp. S159]
MLIGELSRLTGVHVETIRYYERSGILHRAQRTENGRRSYGDRDVQRLTFIRHARKLGFELSTIRALLALQENPAESCQEVINITRGHFATVQDRITRLIALRDELRRMVEICGGGRVAECQIIDALNGSVGTNGAKPQGNGTPAD